MSSFATFHKNSRKLASVLFDRFLFSAPSLLTVGNLFCGFYSMNQSIEGVNELSTGNITEAAMCFDRAAIWIIYSFLFDFFDGRLARFLGSTSHFGIWLDAVADMISFGIAPSLLMYTWGVGQEPVLQKLFLTVSLMFAACGALRLVRFNRDRSRREKDSQPTNSYVNAKVFVGMPITAGAAVIISIVRYSPTPLAYNSAVSAESIRPWITIAHNENMAALIVLLLVISSALLMISRLHFPSFKDTAIWTGSLRIVAAKFAVLVILLLICWSSKWGLIATISIYMIYSGLRASLPVLGNRT